MKTSRSLTDLHPKVAVRANQFLAACKKQGIEVIITSTLRDNEAQNALYAQGRTTAGNKVTNAKGGQSFHNYGLAFDFLPLTNGKPDWNNLKLFEQCGVIAEGLGLEWAGRWKTFKEYAHCQFTGGLTLKDLQQGKKLL